MKTIPVQTDNVTQLAATNFNPIPREIENAIKSQSIALDNSGANASQLAESISEAVSLNDLYQDSGSANVYTLSPIGQRKGLTQYIDGMTVRFEPAVNNSGASTVNVNSTGARKVYKNGVELSGGEITTGSSYSIEYDEVLDGGFGGFKLSKKTFTPSFGVSFSVGWLHSHLPALLPNLYPMYALTNEVTINIITMLQFIFFLYVLL